MDKDIKFAFFQFIRSANMCLYLGGSSQHVARDVITGDDAWRDEAVNRYQQQQPVPLSRLRWDKHAMKNRTASNQLKLNNLDSFQINIFTSHRM